MSRFRKILKLLVVYRGAGDALPTKADYYLAMRRSYRNINMSKTQQILDTTPIRHATPAMTRARERAVRMVLDGTAWSTAREVGERADLNAKNKHALASRLVKERRVFTLERGGVNEFPDYQFDAQGNPVLVMRDVLKIFAGYSPFRIASWFESTSSALGGRRPREMLADHPDQVVAAAKRDAKGPQHG